MHRSLLAIGFALTISTAIGQTTPKTKTEAFTLQYGTVLISGFTDHGFVEDLGIITVNSWEFKSPTVAKKELGVVFEVKGAGRLERESRSFVDYDELESLIKGFDFITKLDKSITKQDNFQATYRTKGDFELIAFSEKDGSVGLGVSSGTISKSTVYLKKENFAKFRNLIITAKSRLETLK